MGSRPPVAGQAFRKHLAQFAPLISLYGCSCSCMDDTRTVLLQLLDPAEKFNALQSFSEAAAWKGSCRPSRSKTIPLFSGLLSDFSLPLFSVGIQSSYRYRLEGISSFFCSPWAKFVPVSGGPGSGTRISLPLIFLPSFVLPLWSFISLCLTLSYFFLLIFMSISLLLTYFFLSLYIYIYIFFFFSFFYGGGSLSLSLSLETPYMSLPSLSNHVFSIYLSIYLSIYPSIMSYVFVYISILSLSLSHSLPLSLSLYIYIYVISPSSLSLPIYIYVVKLLIGPSLALFKVINWSKVMFAL